VSDSKALQEELEALQTALKTEEDGYAYYMEASNRTSHPLAKKFFASVAGEEMVHIALIKEFHKSLREEREGSNVVLPQIPPDYKQRLKTIFEEARRDLSGKITPDTGVLDVYRTSMELETKAANFYQERARSSAYEPVRKLYDWLFHFESDHYRMFSETLSYLEKPEQWFMEQEKSIFEG